MIEFDRLSRRVIGCALEVHRNLGPGLLEASYQQCLAYELGQERLSFRTQAQFPVLYKGQELDCGFRVDLEVESQLIAELKSVSSLAPIHRAQLLTYLKLAKIRVGLLINFNSRRLSDGIERLVV